MSKQRSTLSKERNFNAKLVRHCCRFGNKVERCIGIVAENGNNAEATFDYVAFDNVASTLLLVWTGFKLTTLVTVDVQVRDFFLSPELGTKSTGKHPIIFLRNTRIPFEHNVGQVEGSLSAKNEPDPTSSFDTIPACV